MSRRSAMHVPPSLQIPLFRDTRWEKQAEAEQTGEIRRRLASRDEHSDRASEIPIPSSVDRRSTAVWRQWLASMASDAEAALAAAIAYRDMDAEGRERWLASLEADAPEVDVPAIALYAPLLSVESDPQRRERLLSSLKDPKDWTSNLTTARALGGTAADGCRVYLVSTPLYLRFVQMLACGVREGKFLWVRHDPIVGPEGLPKAGQCVAGARMESRPLKSVLDELAAAVLAHKRTGDPLPEGLSVLSDLLGLLGP